MMGEEVTEQPPAETDEDLKRSKDEDNRRLLEQLNRRHDELKQLQLEELRIDVDAAWTEYRERLRPICFTFEGTEYTIPAEMPGGAVVFISRHCLTELDHGEFLFHIPDNLWHEALDVMLGEQLAAAIKGSDKTFPFINDTVLRPILVKWGVMLRPGQQQEKKTEDPTPE
jgi:hypothetical protein